MNHSTDNKVGRNQEIVDEKRKEKERKLERTLEEIEDSDVEVTQMIYPHGNHLCSDDKDDRHWHSAAIAHQEN